MGFVTKDHYINDVLNAVCIFAGAWFIVGCLIIIASMRNVTKKEGFTKVLAYAWMELWHPMERPEVYDNTYKYREATFAEYLLTLLVMLNGVTGMILYGLAMGLNHDNNMPLGITAEDKLRQSAYGASTSLTILIAIGMIWSIKYWWP